MINKIENGKLKFTSLGNTLNLAKKIAEISNNEVLLSSEIHEKTMSEISADKKEMSGISVFKIKKVRQIDTDNKKFIEDFLKRQEEKK